MTSAAPSPHERLRIAGRFRGPPNSGNGGYASGVAAELFDRDEPVEVTLRSPVPLDLDLQVTRANGAVSVYEGSTLVAEARRAPCETLIPQPPSLEAVVAAQPTSPSFLRLANPIVPDGFGIHPVCFCCGADRHDGLRVFAAPVADSGQVAALWRTDAHWGDANGEIPDAFLWTALDCPAQFAYIADGVMTGLLGRMTAQVLRPCMAGQDYLVTGWRVGVEGKKNFAGTAVFNLAGELIAKALTVWIGRREGFFPT